MDAPKGRYRVVEKDGRLIVLDNGTPIPSSVKPPPSGGRPGAGPAAPVGPGEPGMIDRAGAILLRAVAREWDREGRAVIAWEWKENGRTKRWDAALDSRQQRRLGRALVAVFSAPLFVVLLVMTGFWAIWLGLFVVPAVMWGVIAISRLQRETSGA